MKNEGQFQKVSSKTKKVISRNELGKADLDQIEIIEYEIQVIMFKIKGEYVLIVLGCGIKNVNWIFVMF